MIIDAEADLKIQGYRDRVFTPQRVPHHVLTSTLPAGVEFRVPQAFALVAAQGDQFAGLRAWGYRDCEITLAWAPGPTEPLRGDTALVLVEATYDPEYAINIEAGEQATWGEDERSAFLYHERWKGETKTTPAEALVVQGPNYLLFALRIRARTQDQIHPLCRDVRGTFGFVETE